MESFPQCIEYWKTCIRPTALGYECDNCGHKWEHSSRYPIVDTCPACKMSWSVLIRECGDRREIVDNSPCAYYVVRS